MCGEITWFSIPLQLNCYMLGKPNMVYIEADFESLTGVYNEFLLSSGPPSLSPTLAAPSCSLQLPFPRLCAFVLWLTKPSQDSASGRGFKMNILGITCRHIIEDLAMPS